MGLHGVVVTEGAVGGVPLVLPDISSIGIVGTAPGIDVDGKLGRGGRAKWNEPFLMTSRADASDAVLGTTGTLPGALSAIYAQGRAKVVVIPLPEYAAAVALADIASIDYIGLADDFDDMNGSDAEFTVEEVEGGYEIVLNTDNTGFDIRKSDILALGLGQEITLDPSTGTDTEWVYEITGLPIEIASVAEDTTATPPVLRVEGQIRILVNVVGSDGTAFDDGTETYTMSASALTAVAAVDLTRDAVIGSSSADPRTGVYALLDAESETGVRPSIILAPDLDTGSGDSGSANALGKALDLIARQLRAIAIIGGPNTTHVAAATDFPEQYGEDRTYLVDPFVKVFDADAEAGYSIKDAAPFVAGTFVANDVQRGWWSSPSNFLIKGILGTARPVDFVMGDASSRAQLLNDVAVATIVNIDGGYRLWGNETPASGDRGHWKFVNVRRIADVLYKAVQDNHLFAVDKGITKNYLGVVADGVNAFIRTLVSKEALYGGICYPDADLNTEANISLGEVYFNIEYTPVYPAQTVNFQVNLVTRYITSLAA